MRRFLFASLLLLFFSGCNKSNPTTYQVINTIVPFDSNLEHYDGSMYQVMVYYFIGDDFVDTKTLGTLNSGGDSSEIIEISDDIEKIKVSFKYLPVNSIYFESRANHPYYLAAFKFLNQGEHHEIIVDNHTMVSNKIFFGTAETMNSQYELTFLDL